MSWVYFGMYEMWDIVKALFITFLLLVAISFVLRDLDFFRQLPRSVFFMDFVFSLLLVSGLRISKRFYLHIIKNKSVINGLPTLVIGAGDAGEQIVRDMRRNPNYGYCPFGFIDDDSKKKNLYIHGVKVFGNRRMIPHVVERHQIEAIIIAIPSASMRELKDILSYATKTGVSEIKTMPGMAEISDGKVTVSDLKDLRIEHILGRTQATVDQFKIKNYLNKKRILITGAGGSIGSELMRQVLSYNPERIVALDIDETELFHIEQEVQTKADGVKLCPVVADIRDIKKISWVFENHKPNVVFHAAAYKHVPMMEAYPEEAVKTNVFGTKNVAEASAQYGVEQFVMVSTDKAVRPTNVMGATKKIAEKIVKELQEKSNTSFISVRFGNVVGSRGSVVPTFQKQIRQGGPVTVTHEDMTRYFMSIPEAVTLILQAGAFGVGAEVFVLKMGDPVKIIDVAKEMIRLHGFEPEVDIPIVFTGIRPGEKLHEQLLTADEGVVATEHDKIMKVKDSKYAPKIMDKLYVLDSALANHDSADLRASLSRLVKTYKPESYLLGKKKDDAIIRKIEEYMS